MGGMLHDIGMIKLPDELRSKGADDLSETELALYKTHPKLGLDVLDTFSMIGEPVKQIVFQHHEAMDGSGFPNNLSGSKIYPMARVVSLADHVAENMISKKVAVLDYMKDFIPDRSLSQKYDPTAIRALLLALQKK